MTCVALCVAGGLAHPAYGQSAEDAINNAVTAAPAAVSAEATVYGFDEAGAMITLREGKNGWWCMADNPGSPGNDPMCGDANAMEWAGAWMGKTDPPQGKVGFMYMLAGGSDSSNTDPYATGPADGNHWVTTGPHVMIVNATGLMAGYPDTEDPDTARPYVMWPGTPYAHLMVPVQ
ncbi:hypothetical protein G4Z14_16705 [Rhodobacteraceae bacterium KMS-5]|uniref:Uncharacterized protein n=1 Tax=Tabrizicola oligotrophica TaxID=2710650 RepID=A0A6M0QZI9_9RHOB|nr:hypothetical protein [Tabrizicola oligotrophica]